MNYAECYPFETDAEGNICGRQTPKKNDIVKVTMNQASYDSGKTWSEEKYLDKIETNNLFTGMKTTDGPSHSYQGKIESGRWISYCSQYNGKRWISLKNK